MAQRLYFNCFLFIISVSWLMALELPVSGSCKSNEYLEPSATVCLPCPANASLVSSADGFACSCEEHSVPISPGRCRPCGPTAVVSSDGMTCVPRRCQTVAGRTVCRRCPADYISVTHNFDGSPMKEVLCVRCARGFKARGNACERCAECACARTEVAVRGACVPRGFVSARPRHDGALHPTTLLDVVKYEYLCIQHDYRACRALASECVKSFYASEAAGPCRLWLQPGLVPHNGLPRLLMEPTNDKNPGIDLPRGENTLKLALAIYTADGGLRMLRGPEDPASCFSSIDITIGEDFSRHCLQNISEGTVSDGDTLSLFLLMGGHLTPLPVALRTPNGNLVKRATWPTDKFRRYFWIHNALSTTTNSTIMIYLRTLQIYIRMQRTKSSLRVHLTVEAQYAIKPSYARTVTTILQATHEMPSAGVLRGLEVWGGVLGALLSCHGAVQWRGALRRGALQASLLPILAGSVADALYFAAWLSALHALAAEAGSIGLTLPPARAEEHLISIFVYSAISLKVIKVAWINWRQCTCDIFFLDWSEYNPPIKDELSPEDHTTWRIMALAREWSPMQTRRRASPGLTAAVALALIHLASPWLASLPASRGYSWAVGSMAWWVGYASVLLLQWVKDKLVGSPAMVISRVCEGAGLSLLVFQEEYYAHYVHGRVVYKQLSTPGLGAVLIFGFWWSSWFLEITSSDYISGAMDLADSRQALLSRFLAAFFERALDGLSWVASERTVPERLLDVELATREAGNTSTLLYDPGDSTPSCFALAWWGEEWTLATMDAMLFGCVLLATGDWLLAALVTLAVWLVSKEIRTRFGDKNLKQNIGIENIM